MASALAATSLTPIAEAFSVTSCITCSEHSSMLNSAVQLCHVSAHDSPIGTFPCFDKKSRNPYPCDFRVLKAMEFERRHVGHYQHLPPNLNAYTVLFFTTAISKTAPEPLAELSSANTFFTTASGAANSTRC